MHLHPQSPYVSVHITRIQCDLSHEQIRETRRLIDATQQKLKRALNRLEQARTELLAS